MLGKESDSVLNERRNVLHRVEEIEDACLALLCDFKVAQPPNEGLDVRFQMVQESLVIFSKCVVFRA